VIEPSFAALYRRFLALISQPNPLAQAVHERAATDPGSAELSDWIDAANQEQAVARLGIYAHQYFARLTESLREDFSACASALGPEAFDRLSARYLVAYPSDNASLRYHGRHFTRFLGERAGEFARERSWRTDLADLAALEWARIEVFDAPAAPLLDVSALLSTPADAWFEIELSLVPAHRIIRVRHDIEELWLAAEHSRPLPPAREHERVLSVWRRGFGVFHRAVAASEARALERLVGGTSLAELCSVIAPERPTERAAATVFTLLRQWLADEILITRAATEPSVS
jgi:hypothetical protein